MTISNIKRFNWSIKQTNIHLNSKRFELDMTNLKPGRLFTKK